MNFLLSSASGVLPSSTIARSSRLSTRFFFPLDSQDTILNIVVGQAGNVRQQSGSSSSSPSSNGGGGGGGSFVWLGSATETNILGKSAGRLGDEVDASRSYHPLLSLPPQPTMANPCLWRAAAVARLTKLAIPVCRARPAQLAAPATVATLVAPTARVVSSRTAPTAAAARVVALRCVICFLCSFGFFCRPKPCDANTACLPSVRRPNLL